MGKPALLELLNLIELRLEDDPILGYQTLLELIEFVGNASEYQSYLPMLTSIQEAYQAKFLPRLLTPLPIPYFHGQMIDLVFNIPSSLHSNIRFESTTICSIKSIHGEQVEVQCQPVKSMPFDLDCLTGNIKLHSFMITLVPPVEMDNLGL
jgi:hypothetical protein